MDTPAPSRRRAPLPLALAAAVSGGLALLPLAYLVVRATEKGWAGVTDTLWRDRTFQLTVSSLVLATIVTALSLVIGTSLAWLVTRTDLPFRRTVSVIVCLPLALPSYVAAWGWITFQPGLAGTVGAVVVLTTISYPYVLIPVAAALRRCDPDLEDVARTLGERPLTTFWRVTLPQVRPAATAGGLLVGLYVLSDFGAVATMRHEVLTNVIYTSYRASFDRTPAAVLGCLLATITIAVVLVETRWRRRGIAKVGSGAPRPQRIVRLGGLRLPALLLSLGVAGVSLGVPVRAMVHWFSRGSSRADLTQFAEAARNTLLVGAVGAVAVVLVAAPIGVLAARHPGRVSRTATSAAYAGHALPGVVVGLGLVFFGIRVATPLYQELPLLVVAYVVLFMSLAIGSIHAAVAQVPKALEDVSRTLGRSAWGTWRSVVLRLSAPGIGAAMTLVMLTIMKELPATLFLRPTGFDTLATRLWSHVDALSYAAAAPYAVGIVVAAALPTALLGLLGDKEARR